MTEEQKDKNTARFLVVDTAALTVLSHAPSEDVARADAMKEAEDADDERLVIGVYQKIGTTRIERKAVFKGVAS